MTRPDRSGGPAAGRPPRAYAGLPLLWAAIVLLLTLTPAVDMPRTPPWKLVSFDTAAHAGVFGTLAALSWLSLRRQRRRPALAARAGWVVLVGCFLFGGLIEVLQYAMHLGRHAEWSDLLSDTLGAALAVGVLLLVAGPLRRRGWALALLLPALSLPPLPARSQDMTRVRATIVKLASRGLHGRGYVQQGEHRAAAYLRGRLRQLGLQPLAPDYTQPFELDVNTFPGRLKLRVRTSDRPGSSDLVLQPGADFIAAPDSPATAELSGAISAVDTLALTAGAAQTAALLRGAAEKGPQVLILRQRDEARLQLPENADLLRHWETQYRARLELVDKLTASLAEAPGRQPHLEVLASKWPLSKANSPAATNETVALQIDAQPQRHYPTQNLAAFLPGRTQSDSFLVVTAHYDHLGMMGRKAYFPGANDNASGVAMLLELAAHYARPENRPACSIAFLLFGAEEAGLVGSRYFVQHPLVPLPRIKFLVNLDLLGTGEEGATVVNGRVHEAAFRQLQQLNDAGHYLPGLAARGRAANSDHYPFSEAGVPAFFLYTRGGSKAYHDVHDTPDQLSLTGFAGAFGLLRDFLNAR